MSVEWHGQLPRVRGDYRRPGARQGIVDPADETIPRVSWADFLDRFDWRQGEHVSLVGPTRQGKTTLALSILHRRDFVAALVTKRADPTFERLRKEGWRRITEAPLPEVGRHKSMRVAVWPKLEKAEDVARQKVVFREVMDQVYRSGGWCLYVDELWYLVRELRLEDRLRLLWTQGAGLGVSLVAGTQRPAWVPLELYSQATHLFLWRANDRRDLERLADLGGLASTAAIRRTVTGLERHEVLYVDTRTGLLLRTMVDLGGRT